MQRVAVGLRGRGHERHERRELAALEQLELVEDMYLPTLPVVA